MNNKSLKRRPDHTGVFDANTWSINVTVIEPDSEIEPYVYVEDMYSPDNTCTSENDYKCGLFMLIRHRKLISLILVALCSKCVVSD